MLPFYEMFKANVVKDSLGVAPKLSGAPAFFWRVVRAICVSLAGFYREQFL